jgi:hypothetical protein
MTLLKKNFPVALFLFFGKFVLLHDLSIKKKQKQQQPSRHCQDVSYVQWLGRKFSFHHHLSLAAVISQKSVALGTLMIKKSICFCSFEKVSDCLKLETV